MAKAKKKPRSTWTCRECGGTTNGWFGKCPACQAWNTIEEEVEVSPDGTRIVLVPGSGSAPVSAAADLASAPRLRSGRGEVDRVLGGGLVPGSVVLVGGPPGIGKSTLLLQAGAGWAERHGPVLYASGEESVAQISGRARRLDARHDRLLLLAETRIEAIVGTARHQADGLAVLVLDSIQTIYSDATDGLPGNVSQIRAVANHVIGFAKSHGVPVIVVGHVTKDGQLAGPRLLEHMVDAVLSFDGDEDRVTRLLRATKNRFGSTQELGVFEMTGEGLREIDNPSEAFLGEDRGATPGACITASLEGSRPLLLEVQALLSPCFGGSPRRNCVGVDANRVAMLLAVLDRHGGVSVLDHDVFVNVAGGLRLREPAADLAVMLAVASSHLRRSIRPRTLAFGEVGLTGELRAAPRAEVRLLEAGRLGFDRAIGPARTRTRAGAPARAPDGIEVVEARSIEEALEAALES